MTSIGRQAFFEPSRLRRVRRLLAEADPSGPPQAFFLVPKGAAASVTRLGVLSGSFNPLTIAHTVVAARAQTVFGLDLVAFALSTQTVDKERVAGMLLEDRLLTLELHARRHPGRGVLVLNQGLYVEQAEALRSALPGLHDLSFVVGFDKIVQVLDPRYYADRDAALERLFGLARFIVASRGSDGKNELRALLSKQENRRYADGVLHLPLPARYRELSSSQVREALERGERRVAGLPRESWACIQATGAYRAQRGDRYALRPALIEALMDLPGPLEAQEFRRLAAGLAKAVRRLEGSAPYGER